MSKRRIMILAITAFLFTAFPVYANSIRVTIEGQPVVFADQQPANIDGRTLVPVRGVFEALGFDVDWEAETSTAVLSNSSHEVRITIGSNEFTANGVRHTLDVPAQSIGGRTMLPLRAVLESVGYHIGWDGAANTVLISSSPIAQETPAAQTSWFSTQNITLNSPQTVRPYVTVTNDDISVRTVGSVTLRDFSVVPSGYGFEAREGYEWLIVSGWAEFSDDNAWMGGAVYDGIIWCYYQLEQTGRGGYIPESDGYYTALWNGEEISIRLVSEVQFIGWIDDTLYFERQYAFLVPIGYDGAVISFVNHGNMGTGDNLIECVDEDTVWFRLR